VPARTRSLAIALGESARFTVASSFGMYQDQGGDQRAEHGKRRAGVERPPEPLDEGGVRRAHDIARSQSPFEDVETLRRYECAAPARAALAPSGGDGFGWTWELEDDLAGVLWPVAHSATELLVAGPLGRVKGCAGCNWLFVDESKNRSRRWCAMEECGTHAKMQRYVARRAAKRKSSDL
jgi:CGNR zinc finger